MDLILERCLISSDVYFACMNHALTTEVEEIMGLLIGWTDDDSMGALYFAQPVLSALPLGVCHVTNSVLLKRVDKRKDRVEISPEILASSITICEGLNEERHLADAHCRSLDPQSVV